MRRLMIGLVGVGSLVAVLAGLAVAQSRKPDATLSFSGGSVAAGIGVSWGNGTLSYNGNTYAVRIEACPWGRRGDPCHREGECVQPREGRGLFGQLRGGRHRGHSWRRRWRDGAAESTRGCHRAAEHDPGRECHGGRRGNSARARELIAEPRRPMGMRASPSGGVWLRSPAIAPQRLLIFEQAV